MKPNSGRGCLKGRHSLRKMRANETRQHVARTGCCEFRPCIRVDGHAPIVSGNVSLYNETQYQDGPRAILPTPTVAAVSGSAWERMAGSSLTRALEKVP